MPGQGFPGQPFCDPGVRRRIHDNDDDNTGGHASEGARFWVSELSETRRKKTEEDTHSSMIHRDATQNFQTNLQPCAFLLPCRPAVDVTCPAPHKPKNTRSDRTLLLLLLVCFVL
mmetsp:Transcript_20986/g.47460  ORF Transcript_20986/g.47460 Transcript_20986/m.47460 type:complete len:115 (+) Transcript_20986:1348-1692(+)